MTCVLRRGEERKHRGETRRNGESSRSHVVFRLHIRGGGGAESVLNFVDLAGSENIMSHY